MTEELTFDNLMQMITPDVRDNLRRAIEIGKWPDGRVLTQPQREMCMQAVIAWEQKNLPESERTGYIDRGSKQEDEVCESHTHEAHAEQPVNFRH